jgi:transglutaminase/protease-like cytokinesis protein 3
MKILLTILFTLTILNIQSQNYKLIDDKVRDYPNYQEIDELVLRVNNSFNTDTDKVRAYYTWIALNVAYDLKTYYSIRPPKLKLVFNSKSSNISVGNNERIKIAKQVFKDRKALCLGFSSLFTELCLRSNIEVKTIEGIVKTSVDDIENLRYSKNHSWNMVKINNKWKLLDVTFSSGYADNFSGRWINVLNDFYFFTDPEVLLTSHLPVLPQFQLVSKPIKTADFFKLPIFYNKYFESGLQLSNDQYGLLTLSKNDKKIQLRFKNKTDKAQIYYKFDNELELKKLNLKKSDLNNFTAILKCRSNNSNILTLYYDNHKILDFKIEK